MNFFLMKTRCVSFLIFVFFSLITNGNVFAEIVNGNQSGTWVYAKSPYIVTNNVLVPKGETLIIEPGVVVKFAGYYKFHVDGILIAKGLTGKRIVFTSFNDKEFGTKSNFVPKLPTNKDWDSITFSYSSSNNSLLDHCIIRFCDKVFIAGNANPVLMNLIIVDCASNNFFVNQSLIDIVQAGVNNYNLGSVLEPEPKQTTYNTQTNNIQEDQDEPDTDLFGPATLESDDIEQKEDEFTFGEITVISASKKVQSITEAPAAIYVITEKDIKYSGAVTIPDVLRMVPGLDVMQITASDFVVNARGFNKEVSNKILVLVDGRTVYMDFYGIILWSSFPIIMEDIKRIEVIRGPGSALYGANAFSGVINIITKSPKEYNGTTISIKGGDINTYVTSVIHAGNINKIRYKATFGLDRTNHWNNNDIPSRDAKKIKAVLEYDIDDNTLLSLEGGNCFNDSETFTGIGRLYSDQMISHVRLNYNKPDFFCRAFVTRVRADILNELIMTNRYIMTYTSDIEAQINLNLGLKNSLIAGGNVRYIDFRSDMITYNTKQSLYSCYIQNEYKPLKKLTFTAGARYDTHPLVANQITPRASIVFSPIKDRYVRFSYGTAFRNPSFIETYLSENSDLTSYIASLMPPALSGLPANFLVMRSRGNKNLKPEKITSYEFGYQTYITSWLRGNIDLFYNELQDFISFNTISYQDVSAKLEQNFGINPGPITPVPELKMFTNAGKAKAFGGELGAELLIGDWFKGAVNYSHQKLRWLEDDPYTFDNETNQRVISSPLHKVNTNVRIILKNGFSANIMTHYVTSTTKKQNWAYGKVSDYLLTNLRLGYRFNNGKTEFSISIFNWLNQKHFEYPSSNQQGIANAGHEINNRITAGFLRHSF